MKKAWRQENTIFKVLKEIESYIQRTFWSIWGSIGQTMKEKQANLYVGQVASATGKMSRLEQRISVT